MGPGGKEARMTRGGVKVLTIAVSHTSTYFAINKIKHIQCDGAINKGGHIIVVHLPMHVPTQLKSWLSLPKHKLSYS